MPTTPATSIHIAQPAAKRAGDPNQFTDIVATGLTTSAARAAIDRHAAALPKLRLLWSYYRNPMEHRGGWSATAVSSRGWRLSQERGLPGRLLGAASGGGTGDDRSRARKEIVIENDIAWRIHTMVDFMFGQRVRIASTARDPALRARIDAVLEAVWEASGGIALMQDMALLGNVYGHKTTKTPRHMAGADCLDRWICSNVYAAMVAWACSLHGPRSPVGETQRIHT